MAPSASPDIAPANRDDLLSARGTRTGSALGSRSFRRSQIVTAPRTMRVDKDRARPTHIHRCGTHVAEKVPVDGSSSDQRLRPAAERVGEPSGDPASDPCHPSEKPNGISTQQRPSHSGMTDRTSARLLSMTRSVGGSSVRSRLSLPNTTRSKSQPLCDPGAVLNSDPCSIDGRTPQTVTFTGSPRSAETMEPWRRIGMDLPVRSQF